MTASFFFDLFFHCLYGCACQEGGIQVFHHIMAAEQAAVSTCLNPLLRCLGYLLQTRALRDLFVFCEKSGTHLFSQASPLQCPYTPCERRESIQITGNYQALIFTIFSRVFFHFCNCVFVPWLYAHFPRLSGDIPAFLGQEQQTLVSTWSQNLSPIARGQNSDIA